QFPAPISDHLPNPRQLMGLSHSAVLNVPEDTRHDRPHERGRVEGGSALEGEQEAVAARRSGDRYRGTRLLRHRSIRQPLLGWQTNRSQIHFAHASANGLGGDHRSIRTHGAIGAATEGWVAYENWACSAGLPSIGCAQRE